MWRGGEAGAERCVLVLDGIFWLVAPGGVGGWAYIAFKTLYTSVTAALAAALAIGSVVSEG